MGEQSWRGGKRNNMAGHIRAVIDVGTNSVKILVGRVEGRAVHPLLEDSRQTRLGQGFYESGILQSSAIQMTATAVAEFAGVARAWQASRISVIATSAARDAQNKQELVNAIYAASALPVNVISGEQEGDWAFQGVVTDPALQEQPLLVMDVGGGSTEFILGQNQDRIFTRSFPIGTVRFLERTSLDDPPTPAQRQGVEDELDAILRDSVLPNLAPKMNGLTATPLLVGTGGTTSILARMELSMNEYDREKMEQVVFSPEKLRAHADRLWSMPLARRRQITGLPPNRADVILIGVLIYDRVLALLGLKALRISTRSLRFAALMD